MNTAELSSMSKQVRRDIINMTANAGSGHPGGSLSAADLMTCLFFNHMHVGCQAICSEHQLSGEWKERI